ncbi:MAG: O-methyltransferase [Runella sp.]
MNLHSLFGYFLTAQNQHGLHSPFVFDLYLNTIRSDERKAYFEVIEHIRKQLLHSKEQLQITDLGAGSKLNTSKIRKVSEIARYSQKSARLGRLFYRLIQRFDCQYIFDLGTSLGITTLYLAAANPAAHLFTFEGCPNTASEAKKNFEIWQKNYPTYPLPRQIVGNLDHTLPPQVAYVPRLDFVFFDANHRYEPTLRYFEQCLPKVHNDTLFVFDDIHWSEEMEAAWEQIKNHEAATVTIDLWSVGLVFFRKQQAKQHFVLRWPFWK